MSKDSETVIDASVCFSGRFDPPHIGHIKTILDLAQRYRAVAVVVLNERENGAYPLCYKLEVLRGVLYPLADNVEIVWNTTHFGKMTREEWDDFDCDVYASGNKSVLKHMEKMAVCEYVRRSYEYSGTEIRGNQQ